MILTCIYMNWSAFILKIMRDFRLSENELASLCKVNQPTVNRIARGETEKPYQNTIKRIEEGLKIKIDDSNPEQITYKRNSNHSEDGENGIIDFPLVTNIQEGLNAMVNHQGERIAIPYKQGSNCFALIAKGDFEGLITSGDVVLVDIDIPVVNGNLVTVDLANGKNLIQRYRELGNNLIMLYADGSEPTICQKDQIKKIYRIVRIVKEV